MVRHTLLTTHLLTTVRAMPEEWHPQPWKQSRNIPECPQDRKGTTRVRHRRPRVRPDPKRDCSPQGRQSLQVRTKTSTPTA